MCIKKKRKKEKYVWNGSCLIEFSRCRAHAMSIPIDFLRCRRRRLLSSRLSDIHYIYLPYCRIYKYLLLLHYYYYCYYYHNFKPLSSITYDRYCARQPRNYYMTKRRTRVVYIALVTTKRCVPLPKLVSIYCDAVIEIQKVCAYSSWYYYGRDYVCVTPRELESLPISALPGRLDGQRSFAWAFTHESRWYIYKYRLRRCARVCSISKWFFNNYIYNCELEVEKKVQLWV